MSDDRKDTLELRATVADRDGRPILRVKDLELALTVPQLLHLMLGIAAPKERRCSARHDGLQCKKPAGHVDKHHFRTKKYGARDAAPAPATTAKDPDGCFYCGKPRYKSTKVCRRHYEGRLKSIRAANRASALKRTGKK